MDKRSVASVCVSIFLGAAALSIMFGATAMAQTAGNITEARRRVEVPSDVVVKEMHITLLKFALNLRPAQEPFWLPVETALREMAKWQAKGGAETDANGHSDSSVAHRLRRIAAMAVPLIKALDDNQKRSMMMLARTAGLEMLVASK